MKAKVRSDQEMAVIILIMTTHVNSVSNPSAMWRKLHEFDWIVIPINLPVQSFLGQHFGFYSFFYHGFLGLHTFQSLAILHYNNCSTTYLVWQFLWRCCITFVWVDVSFVCLWIYIDKNILKIFLGKEKSIGSKRRSHLLIYF